MGVCSMLVEFALSAVLLASGFVEAFPQGAPTEACESLSPGRGHGLPLHQTKIPYILVQSAVSYKPGQVINVKIDRVNPEVKFEGFMVQAVDKVTGKYIGRFLDADGLTLMDECSAVTHNNNRLKTAVFLAWVAPQQQRGDVVFRGTIVEKKNIYFEGLVSRLASSGLRRSQNTSDGQTTREELSNSQ